MRTDYLYKDFLHDKKVYNLNEGYWSKTLNKIIQGVCTTDKTAQGFQKWLKTSYANHRKFYDANPIFNALCESQNKAIRIIQEEPEVDSVEISAWVEQSALDNADINELVISLELSKASGKIAEALIQYWILETTDVAKMEQRINRQLDHLDAMAA